MAEDVAETVDQVPAPRKRKTLLIAGAAAALLGAGGGGAWYFLAPGEADKAEAAAPETYVDVPPITVNLRSADGSQRFLKVHLMLVPGNAEAEQIIARMPLLLDSLQPFLRELRPEDIAGSAATFRLKEEALTRANATFGEGAVRDVLIQDLLQQ